VDVERTHIELFDFYKKAFGAVEMERLENAFKHEVGR